MWGRFQVPRSEGVPLAVSRYFDELSVLDLLQLLQLTHGLTEKEISRKGGTDGLAFNSSVKSRTKDYIRNYMKKFGPLFSRQ